MTENEHERHNRLQKAPASWPPEHEQRSFYVDWMIVWYLLAIVAIIVAALYSHRSRRREGATHE